MGDDSAAVFPCFRSDIDDIIGSTHGVFIVFDDNERIAQVAQALEGFQELVVVPLVQADGWFVQDIEDADQARPNLGGQADTLGFAAGQGARRPRQCQVVQADGLQEVQAGLDFLEDLLANELLFFRQFQVIEEGNHVADGQIRQFGDVQAADLDGQRFVAQACTVARRAGLDSHELAELVAHHVRRGFAVAAADHGQDAFKGRGELLHFAAQVLVFKDARIV